jgi:hypothetical protein
VRCVALVVARHRVDHDVKRAALRANHLLQVVDDAVAVVAAAVAAAAA